MNEDQFLILAVKGVIAELPEADRATVIDCVKAMEEMIATHGVLAALACALVGAKLQAINGMEMSDYQPEAQP